MRSEIMIDKADATDVLPLFVGCEDCEPNHSFGPYIRDYFLIHYCISGKGTLCDRLGEHKISAGEMFIIRKGEVTTYFADEHEPWKYVWIAFGGKRASIFSEDRSVYKISSEPFMHILELIKTSETTPDIYISIIYDIIYRLFKKQEHTDDTLSAIRKYIEYNYMIDISVESISDFFGYERTYLYRIFKKRYKMGIKAYIIKARMENARSFLLDGRSVSETASLTGYTDEFNFSRAYKRHFGISPSHTKCTLK